MGFIKRKIHNYLRTKKWRHLNEHNFTVPINDFFMDKVIVGKETYGELFVSNYSYNEKLLIGNFCSIGPNVSFMLNSDHYIHHVSTYPFKAQILNSEKYEATSKGNIIVDDDVWIGYGSIILSGVHIGQGAVIAAGSVVTKDVPPYAVVGGVPAKIIKYRFDEDIRKVLLKIDYAKLDKNTIKENIDLLYQRIDTVRDANYIVTSLMKKIFDKK